MNIETSKIKIVPVHVFYLKMEERLTAPVLPGPGVSFQRLTKPVQPSSYLNYYGGIGLSMNWIDRFVMSHDELAQKINAPNVDIYMMTVDGTEAGMLELVIEDDYVELLYFGLFPQYIGKGLGKYFLMWSVQQAWSYDRKWIQLNTCELDHPNALPTYRKLGFHQYKTTVEERRVLNA
jgi:GNAT superfamily N-acetyltransferase